MQNQLQTEETAAPQWTAPATLETESAIEDIKTIHTAAQRFAAFQQKRKRHRERLAKYLVGLLGAILVPIALLPALLNVFGGNKGLMSLLILLSFLVPPLACVFVSLARRPLSEGEELTRTGGVKAIGDLLTMRSEAISLRDKRAITEALIRLLPQLKVSDASLLNQRHRGLLNYYLTGMNQSIKRTPQTYAFVTAILSALEQVGDASAVPLVRRIATMKTRAPEQKRLKAAAAQCLPALEANLGQVDATQTLLRATMPQTTAPDTLLRPAQSVAPTDTTALLRPAAPVPEGSRL